MRRVCSDIRSIAGTETPEGLTDAFGSVRNCSNPVRGSGGRGPASNGPGGDPWVISQDYVRPVRLTDEELSLQVTYDFDAVTLKSIHLGK